jgi:thiol-disulfide isomerase/thioredoxin
LDLFLKKAGNLNSSKASIVKLFGVPEDLNKRKSYVEKVLPTINSEWVQNILKRNLEADNSRLKDLSNLLKIQSVTDSISSIGKYIATLNDSTIFFESNHDKILHLINSIRKRNNGQMIILDVWATWCSPCINDMLESKEKKILLNKKGVKVVYLCVQNGSSIENWKMKVAETSAFGDHIFLNNKLSSELMELFKLSGYPSYIVIDKEGKYYPDLINSISQIDISKIDEILH